MCACLCVRACASAGCQSQRSGLTFAEAQTRPLSPLILSLHACLCRCLSLFHSRQSVMQKQQQQIKCAAEASSVKLELERTACRYFVFSSLLGFLLEKHVKRGEKNAAAVTLITIYVCLHGCVLVCISWESIKHTYLDFWCNML